MSVVPRCSHGNIILGCSHEDCPEEIAYVKVMNDRYAEWYRSTLPSSIPMDSDDETGN